MPTSALASIPPTYPELLRAVCPELRRRVRRGLIDGRREIDRGWVRGYHETKIGLERWNGECLTLPPLSDWKS